VVFIANNLYGLPWREPRRAFTRLGEIQETISRSLVSRAAAAGMVLAAGLALGPIAGRASPLAVGDTFICRISRSRTARP